MSTTFKKDQGGTHQSGTQQARDMAGQAADKTKEVAGQVSDTVQHAAQAAGQKAEDATAAVGSGIQSVAAKVREQGPNTGMLGSATQTVAGAIDETGKYLQDKNLSGMMDDMTGLIKRNPIPAVLIGLGVGFLIGRVLSSSTRS